MRVEPKHVEHGPHGGEVLPQSRRVAIREQLVPFAYGFLQCSVRFPVAYFDCTKPLPFVDSRGRSTPVRTFGLRIEDANGAIEQRRQVQVLFDDAGADGREFALDLCRSAEVQIVFARISKADTLARTIANVQELASRAGPRSRIPGLMPSDIMLVPNMNWQVTQGFTARGGLAQAVQDTRFRLDRRGAELRSEAKMYVLAGGGAYVGDGPFLVYITRRGASVPFLAVWIETSELLERF